MSKLKIINIWITPIERKKMNDLKNKYHLSFSTITNIVTNILYLCDEIRPTVNDHYIYEDKKSTKTSIKPSTTKQAGGLQIDKPTMVYTNCLKIFLNDDLKNYLNDKKRQKVNNMIYNEFQNTYDEYWNGNVMCRFIPKFFKQNPDYCKKILKIEGEN